MAIRVAWFKPGMAASGLIALSCSGLLAIVLDAQGTQQNHKR
jgi:hypothetical protein